MTKTFLLLLLENGPVYPTYRFDRVNAFACACYACRLVLLSGSLDIGVEWGALTASVVHGDGIKQ